MLQPMVKSKGGLFAHRLDCPSWSWVWSAKFNPASNICDGGFGESPGRWHPKVRIVIFKGLKKP
tara:strand:+ start:182 stop:373 length:192 start_codon:yes stop_codon:yes gene_type:complete